MASTKSSQNIKFCRRNTK